MGRQPYAGRPCSISRTTSGETGSMVSRSGTSAAVLSNINIVLSGQVWGWGSAWVSLGDTPLPSKSCGGVGGVCGGGDKDGGRQRRKINVCFCFETKGGARSCQKPRPLPFPSLQEKQKDFWRLFHVAQLDVCALAYPQISSTPLPTRPRPPGNTRMRTSHTPVSWRLDS